ncbi:hypothetical protein JCM11641_008345 [Rhodosporidiobolus odoratus]
MAAPLVLPDSPPLPAIPSSPSLRRFDTIRPSKTSTSDTGLGIHSQHSPLSSYSTQSSSHASWSPLPPHPASPSTAGPSSSSTRHPSELDLHLLPHPPQPPDLLPFLLPTSPLSPSEKRTLFTSVYLRSASSGNPDTLEWLLSLPHDPLLSSVENAAAQRRFSLTAVQMNNGLVGPGGQARGGGGGGELPDSAPRKWVDLEATDEEGNTALGLCVALGHAEAVRVLVESGVRVNQGDRGALHPSLALLVLGNAVYLTVRVFVLHAIFTPLPPVSPTCWAIVAGWTPLHWAVQNNDIPIASYLLNHRASPLLASHKGLTARDLVKPTKEGSAMREVLQSAWEAAVERERAVRRAESEMNGAGGGVDENGVEGKEKGKGREEGLASPFEGAGGGGGSGRPSSRLSMASLGGGQSLFELRAGQNRGEEKEREAERKRKVQLGMDSAHNLEVDMGVLGLGEGSAVQDSDEPDEEDEEGVRNPFVWDRCLPDQMLVFALTDLPTLFDVIITTIKPVRERKYRVIPANVLFLCARFAQYFGNEELLEELMIGAMERIEGAVHNRPDDMANCAFWLSNCLLLLYYLRKEPHLSFSTSTYQTHLCDLVNEIFVFVIRDAERRIDRVLEAALLEHEALPGFEDVAFEDEWASTRFVKKLTGRAKKGGIRNSTSARSLFSAAAGSAGGSDVSSSSAGVSIGDSPPPRQRHVSASQVPIAEATPRSITALLSSTLFVLQIYEIPPSIVVQAFSQLFYWIACEVFNRLLTQRKYLCRSRAMQIRLNASNLEDWARANRLPTKMVSVHFTPLNQLLQWLQCLSSESSIDGLIGTVQSLHALNPMQLRKAVREYRYEIEESKLDVDCKQYLVQIQKQWERLRMQKKVDGLGAGGGGGGGGGGGRMDAGFGDEVGENGFASPGLGGGGGTDGVEDDASVASAQEDVVRMIDEAFADPASFGSYTPPGGAEALGELLNSRYMLPFAVPTSAEMLVNFNQPDAFGPFANSRLTLPRTNSEGTATPRSSSRLSLGSNSRFSTPASSFSPPVGFGAAATDDSTSIRSFSTEASRPLSLSLSSSSSSTQPRPEGVANPCQEPFRPVLPDDFFAVWDAAKMKSGLPVGPSLAAALLAGVESWEKSPAVGGGAGGGAGGGGWTGWRSYDGAGSGGGVEYIEEEEEEDEGEEGNGGGSVVDHEESREEESGKEGEGEGDVSFGSEEGVVEQTPRPRTGFQP